MSDEVKLVQSGGIGLFGLLAIVFITLKLTGTIAWSWWLVLLPLYGPLAFILGVVILFLIIALIVMGIAKLRD